MAKGTRMSEAEYTAQLKQVELETARLNLMTALADSRESSEFDRQLMEAIERLIDAK